MSLTFKLLSLVIRTAAKPIGNYIKRQTREHDGFRTFAVKQAQRVHRIDMRMRLGILHDSEAQERMHERERKREEEKKRKSESPTVRTEEEQKRFEDEERTKETAGEKKAEKPKPPVIRPLSEAKAIELGANFFSEAFIFGVAAGLLIWDAWRSRRKETARRDDVRERLGTLEAEVDRLRLKYEPHLEPLSDNDSKDPQYGWYDPRAWWTRTDPVVNRLEGQAKAIEASVSAPVEKDATKSSVAADQHTAQAQTPPKVTTSETEDKSTVKPKPTKTKSST